MKSIKIGDKLVIHCYKHNGKIHRLWDEALVLDINDEMIVCGNNKVKITEADGRNHRTDEPAIVFLFKKSWFHITGQLKRKGLFYKCDMASPFLIDGGIIKYIDYDLDLRVFPDGGFKILDKNEYKYHKKIMGYSKEIDLILKSELNKLIIMKKSNVGPFDKDVVNNYYTKYIELKENCNK